MTNDRYGMVALVGEFIISLVVLLGGGFLLYSGHSPEVAVSGIATVIAFWFARRSAEASTKQLQQFQQSQQAFLPEIPAVQMIPQQIPFTAQPAEPRAPDQPAKANPFTEVKQQ